MAHYCRPPTLNDALAVLGESDGKGRILVGGTDLLVHTRRDPYADTVLIDIKGATDLAPAMEVVGDTVRFGPTASMAALADHADVAGWFPAVVAASKVVGSVAIRNRATLIGNICNASPACDTAPGLLVHGAVVTIAGPAGQRELPLHEFFLAPGKTACGADEIVIRLDVPVPADGTASAFERLTRRRGVDLATVNLAARVDPDGAITLALGCVGPTPLLTATSGPVDHDDTASVEAAVDELISIATPISDVRATKEYRTAMTRVLALRAVGQAAWSRA